MSVGRAFEKAMRVSGSIGAQLSLIVDDGQLDFAHGLANLDRRIAMTEDTAIQIGSVTKLFNAVMILTLVEEGRLELDRPIKSYLSEFEVADDRATREITLRHLLSMSSGLDNGDYGDYGVGEDAIAKRVRALRTLPQHFRPGEHFGYSNAGTDISGHVAERVTGKVWDDLIRERIIEPLDLRNTATLDRDRLYQRISVGHQLDPQTQEPRVIRPWGLSRGLAPAGSTLTTSAQDLVRFGKLFINKGQTDSGVRILSENSVLAMMAPQVDVLERYFATSWCLGPCKTIWNGVSLWGHPGGNVSGMSYLFWVPERRAVIAWINNTPCSMSRMNKVVMCEVAPEAFGLSKPELEVPSRPITIDPSRYVGTYSAVGGDCKIECHDGVLRFRKVWRDFTNEELELHDAASLIPVGGDRFLVMREDRDPMVLIEDLAFFGDDGGGHASNIAAGLFPCSADEPRSAWT